MNEPAEAGQANEMTGSATSRAPRAIWIRVSRGTRVPIGERRLASIGE